jgi:putative endonuclease
MLSAKNMDEPVSITKDPAVSAAAASKELGRSGERLAAEFLAARGYHLIMANFKVPIGRNRVGTQVSGEIDLIALDGDTLCFIEVKTRTSADFASPLTAIGLRKQRQITRAARVYRHIFDIRDMAFRYDAVTVVYDKPRPKIELIRGYWTEDRFRKKFWSGRF